MKTDDGNSKPLVSVIMIFYNEERFIEEAIESVFAQMYQNWELLLVDDGSTDESTSIARCYEEQYPAKVRYLEHAGHQNQGMSAARNLGIQNAIGEFLAFLDADDVWLPHKLETQVALFAENPEAAMVYGPTQWWYSWTRDPEDNQLDYIHKLGVSADRLLEPPDLLVRFLGEEGISPCTCSVLLRREAAVNVGGFEESFRGLYEDQAFFAKICISAPIFVSKECSARYRQHPNSNCAVSEMRGEYDAARPAFLNWLTAYLSETGVSNREVWKAVHIEIRAYRFPFVKRLIEAAREGLPGKLRRSLKKDPFRWKRLPIIRHLRAPQFRRMHPLGNGRQQGTPIVRYYWENFLLAHQRDVHGHALEVGTTHTILRIGAQRVMHADAIDLTEHSPEINVVADLSRADHLPSDRYDCFLNQFTMHLIYDVRAALYHSIRILKPGGTLLINFPCVDYYFANGLDMGTGEPLHMYWWFTPIQVETLLRQAGLGAEDYRLEIYGNLLARTAYQINMPAEELTPAELAYHDPGHPLLICARVVKPVGWRGEKPVYQEAWRPNIVPARWNQELGHYSS